MRYLVMRMLKGRMLQVWSRSAVALLLSSVAYEPIQQRLYVWYQNGTRTHLGPGWLGKAGKPPVKVGFIFPLEKKQVIVTFFPCRVHSRTNVDIQDEPLLLAKETIRYSL